MCAPPRRREYGDFYSAARAHDGLIGQQDGGDWASAGEQDPWIRLEWDEPVDADRVVLYDRPGVDDVNAGTLTFSDGSTVVVNDIPPTREPKTVPFPDEAVRLGALPGARRQRA